MNERDWKELVETVRDTANIDAAVTAAETLRQNAREEDVPRLRQLLEDRGFFVREAAAWPLSELAGADALPDLFRAYQRSLDEGHDNDGFSTALIEMVEANRDEVRRVLTRLAASDDPAMRENAEWLLEFCGNK